MHLNRYRKLLRIEQWYKNVLILTAFLFTNNSLSLGQLALGFFGLCTLSSVTYIFNDWMDREKDKIHPNKKDRPFASGKLSGTDGLVIALLLLSFSVFVCLQLGTLYAVSSVLYFIATNLYSLGLKNIPLLDLTLILLNFNLRTLAGFQGLPQLNDAVYFLLLSGLVLFSLTSKRKADRKLLGEKAVAHKPVLAFYSQNVCRTLIVFSYLLVLSGVFVLAFQNEAPFEALLFILTVLYTSFCFRRDPTLAVKPHYLFKNPVWTLLFLSLLGLPLL